MKITETSLPLLKEARPKKERITTNTLSHHHRVQRWANFIAGYSVEFVEQCLSSRNKAEDVVIDPFLGCGTTLVTAKNLGFESVGFDRHQVFFNLAKAKLGNYNLRDLNRIKEQLCIGNHPVEWSINAKKFLQKLFTDEDLGKINLASGSVNNFGENLRPLAIAFFLRACEASCGAQTDGIYKAPTSAKKRIPFETAIKATYNIFREDIESDWYCNHWIYQPRALCINKSSVNIDEVKADSIGICITSPPYLNNFDYAEMTRMHLYLLGWAGSWGEISTNVRNDLISNTTTALKGKKSHEYQQNSRASLPMSLLNELDMIVTDLQNEKKTRAGKKEYDYLIYLYYAEIKKVLSNLYRVLKDGGIVHWIVADAALYGVHIKTHLHTAEIMRHLGFEDIEIKFIRRRGHRWILSKRDGTKEGLGEYHLTACKK